MRNHSGTYALILSSSNKRQIAVGKLGTLQLKPGFYIYIGSAFGPGGLKARIAHHCKRPARPRWHLDYLGSFLDLVEIWYTYDPVHREHQWAQTLSATKGATVPLAGFGSSDCRCKSHLFFFNSKPAIRSFRHKVYASIENHDKVLFENAVPPRNLADMELRQIKKSRVLVL
jgi:Uri superfamily endonuclease